MIPPLGVGGDQELAESSFPDFNRRVASLRFMQQGRSELHAKRVSEPKSQVGGGAISMPTHFKITWHSTPLEKQKVSNPVWGYKAN
jgi:hypothetical protein